MSKQLDYEIKRTILIELQESSGFVKLKLKNSETIYGIADVIIYICDDEDDEVITSETPYIRFLPNGKLPARLFKEDIDSFEPCNK